jgi:hypothetical protein
MLIGAAEAGELNPQYDYATNDYPTLGSRPTDSEYLLVKDQMATREGGSE